jgi:hypothetical protein
MLHRADAELLELAAATKYLHEPHAASRCEEKVARCYTNWLVDGRQLAQRREMLGDGGRRTPGALEPVTVGAHRRRRDRLGHRVGAEERGEGPVHSGVRAPRLRRALPARRAPPRLRPTTSGR